MKRKPRERLPEYMVPTGIIVLDEMPLTANGKVDRKALPEPDEARVTNRQETGASKSAIEEIIAGIWAEVLGVKEVGVEEDFFELGGHSLMAIRVVSKVREVLGVEISLRTIFERPTVTGLAQAAESAIEGRHGKGVDKIEKASRGGEARLSYAQARLWVMDQLMEGGGAYNVPAAMRLTGRLNRAVLEQSIREIIRRHEVLRTVIVTEGGEARQEVRSGGEVSIEEIDISQLLEEMTTEQVERLVRQESCRGFDLARGPLMRVKVIKQGKEQQVLAVTMHHIVTDGWSMSVMIEEMRKLYEAYSRGEESGLEELKIQYADYAQWQRQWLVEELIEKQLHYWKHQLAGAPRKLRLLTDDSMPRKHEYRGSAIVFEIDEEVTDGLKQLCRREGVSMFMMLLAAYNVFLYRYTGQTDILIGTPVANRNREDIENLIGFFANMLVIRTDLSANPGFRDLLKSVRKVTLEAYAHQDLPFEKLVEALQPDRDLSLAPFFQVVFTLQSGQARNVELTDLTLVPLIIDLDLSKYDLVFNMHENGSTVMGRLAYNCDLFSPETINLMVGYYNNLLGGIVNHPDARLSEINILFSEEKRLLERESVVDDFNRSFLL
jgi:acyl carrier protein